MDAVLGGTHSQPCGGVGAAGAWARRVEAVRAGGGGGGRRGWLLGSRSDALVFGLASQLLVSNWGLRCDVKCNPAMPTASVLGHCSCLRTEAAAASLELLLAAAGRLCVGCMRRLDLGSGSLDLLPEGMRA